MKKDIEIKHFIMIMIALMVVEGVLVCAFLGKNKRTDNSMCANAVCNGDNSLCYVYDLDESGKTIVKWKGSCQK